MLKSSHLVREKMTEAARQASGTTTRRTAARVVFLTVFIGLKGKGGERLRLSTSPRKLIVGEERGHPQRVKRVSRICQAADCSDSGAEASDRTSSKPRSRKRATRQVHNRNRTASQVRDATELPYSVLPHHQSE